MNPTESGWGARGFRSSLDSCTTRLQIVQPLLSCISHNAKQEADAALVKRSARISMQEWSTVPTNIRLHFFSEMQKATSDSESTCHRECGRASDCEVVHALCIAVKAQVLANSIGRRLAAERAVLYAGINFEALNVEGSCAAEQQAVVGKFSVQVGRGCHPGLSIFVAERVGQC